MPVLVGRCQADDGAAVSALVEDGPGQRPDVITVVDGLDVVMGAVVGMISVIAIPGLLSNGGRMSGRSVRRCTLISLLWSVFPLGDGLRWIMLSNILTIRVN